VANEFFLTIFISKAQNNHMKKSIFFLLLGSSCFYSSHAQDEDNDKFRKGNTVERYMQNAEQDELSGKVKSIISIQYQEVYDSMKVGLITDSVVMKYNESGIKTDGEAYSFDPQTRKLWEVYKYTYNDRGEMIGLKTYDATGNLKETVVCKYNGLGREKEESSYYSDGSFSYKETYTYDNNGNLVEVDQHQSDNDSKTTYKYDTKNRQIEMDYSDPKADFGAHVYSYDSNGNLIKQVMRNSANFGVGTLIFTYDDSGYRKEVDTYTNQDTAGEHLLSTDNYKYTFDSFNNWIERIEKDKLVASTIVALTKYRRTIEYYQ
jgi:hypothetical protein